MTKRDQILHILRDGPVKHQDLMGKMGIRAFYTVFFIDKLLEEGKIKKIVQPLDLHTIYYELVKKDDKGR
jgi:hypothetical protein